MHRRQALFDDAIDAIERDFADEHLSLGAVARSIATSRRQLQRVFCEHDTSFRTEVQRVRMSRAAELLRDERLAVSEVAAGGGLSPARSVLEGLPAPPRRPALGAARGAAADGGLEHPPSRPLQYTRAP